MLFFLIFSLFSGCHPCRNFHGTVAFLLCYLPLMGDFAMSVQYSGCVLDLSLIFFLEKKFNLLMFKQYW